MAPLKKGGGRGGADVDVMTTAAASVSSVSAASVTAAAAAATAAEAATFNASNVNHPDKNIPIALRFVHGDGTVRVAMLTLPRGATESSSHNTTNASASATSLGQLKETIRETFGIKSKDKFTLTLQRGFSLQQQQFNYHAAAAALRDGNEATTRVDTLLEPQDTLEIRVIKKTTRIVKVMRKFSTASRQRSGSLGSQYNSSSNHPNNSNHDSSMPVSASQLYVDNSLTSRSSYRSSSFGQQQQQQQQQQHLHQAYPESTGTDDNCYKPVEHVMTTGTTASNDDSAMGANGNFSDADAPASPPAAVRIQDKQDVSCNPYQNPDDTLNDHQKLPARPPALPQGLTRNLSDTSSLTTPEESSGQHQHSQSPKQQQQQQCKKASQTQQAHHQRNASLRTLEDTHKKFYCPLLLFCLMADPVAAEDGYTYERSSIQDHFASLIAQQEKQRQQGNSLDNSNNNNIIMNEPAAVVWSPMTRQVISQTLIPNRVLEEMIVEAVESGELSLSSSDLEDWQQRRALKLALERSRADERASTHSLPFGTTMNNDEDEEYDDIAAAVAGRRRQSSRLTITRPQQYPANLLSRLVRLDRPTAEERFGDFDSGLSVALPVDPPPHGDIQNSNNGPYCCAVSFCLTPLFAQQQQQQDSQNASGTTSVGINSNCESFCPRCQRHVCSDCNRVEVSDILRGTRFKTTHTICVECVWQVADVLASPALLRQQDTNMSSPFVARTVRERLIRGHVAPRLEKCMKMAMEMQRNSLRCTIFADKCSALQDEITSMKNGIKELDRLLAVKRKAFEKSLENAKCKYLAVPNPENQLQQLEERFSAVVGNALDLKDAVPDAPQKVSSSTEGLSDARHSIEARLSSDTRTLAMSLSYPTVAVKDHLQGLQEGLESFVREQRPLIELEALQEKMRLRIIRDEREHRLRTTNKQCGAIDELSKYLDVLTSVDEPPRSHLRTISATLICDELLVQPTNAARLNADDSTVPLCRYYMCPDCHAGPVEQAPATGCPNQNCSHVGGEDWMLWDGQVGPHD